MLEDVEADATIDLLEALVESSLVQERDRGVGSWFSMLATVREYAWEELETRGALGACRQRHAEFFSALAVRAEPHLIGADQREWMARLTDELDDLRAALEYYAETRQGDAIIDLIWPLYWFWFSNGRTRELMEWVRRVIDGGYAVSDQTRIKARFYVAGFASIDNPDPSRIPELQECVDSFAKTSDRFGEFLGRVALGSLELMQGPSGLDVAEQELKRAEELAASLRSPFLTSMALQIAGQVPLGRGDVSAAVATFEASLDAAKACGEILMQSAALYQLAWSRLVFGDHAGARDYFVQSLLISRKVWHEHGIANSLEGLFAVAVAEGDVDRAGELLGAAEEFRARRALLGPGMLPYYQGALAKAESSTAADVFRAARERGRRAEITAVVDVELGDQLATEQRPKRG
jgi:hypothetical protein